MAQGKASTDAPDRLTAFLIRFRWLFVVPVLLPLSVLFKLWWSARERYIRTLGHAPERHDARVADIQHQIGHWRASGARGLLCTSRPSWMTMSSRIARYKRPENAIRIELNDILDIDTARGVARVEPRVTIGRLLDRLLPMGWTLPVVPELEDLTTGGLFLGYGVEVSSHRHGLFNDNVLACDVVLGDGRMVRASATERADLFRALPFSLGALGFVVALELRLVPAAPYVRLAYIPAHSFAETCRIFADEACRADAADFVEAIVFSPTESVVIAGRFDHRAEPGRVHRANAWHAPWFAARSRRFVAAGGGEEWVPLDHFNRRHLRGIYWEAGLIVPFGNHPLFRYLLGWMMPPKIAFLKLTQGERIKRFYDEKHIVQDALVPLRELEATLAFLEADIEGYPLWLCPMRLDRTTPQGFVGPGLAADSSEMYVDVGVFVVPGPVRRGEGYSALDAVARLERFLIAHRGYQAPYAVSMLDRDGFRRMFDCRLYDAVRERYGAAGALMDVFDKLRRGAADGG
jgi:delta24-sterol reductase